MDRKGFVDFNTRLSPENSGKADSYARAIEILDNVLPYQNTIDLQGKSLYELSDVTMIKDVLQLVNEEVKKMRIEIKSMLLLRRDLYFKECATGSRAQVSQRRGDFFMKNPSLFADCKKVCIFAG